MWTSRRTPLPRRTVRKKRRICAGIVVNVEEHAALRQTGRRRRMPHRQRTSTGRQSESGPLFSATPSPPLWDE